MMASAKYSSIMQNIVEFRLEDVPKLVKMLEDLTQSLKQTSCMRDFDTSEESRDVLARLSVQAYCSALRSARVVRAIDKVLRCLPASHWAAFLLGMEVQLEHLLVSTKLADVKTLSALLDQGLATQLGLDKRFHACSGLVQRLLEMCSSHLARAPSCVADEEFQHYSIKLCIQVMRLFAQDVRSAFSSTCTDEDAADVASARKPWKTILTALSFLLIQSPTQDTAHLTGTAMAMVVSYAPDIDVTQTTCQGLLSMLSCGQTSLTFTGLELNTSPCLSQTAADVSVPMSGIIRGMLVCCSKETLSQGKSPVLWQVWPHILQLCQGPSTHHYQAFSLLALWYQKLDYTGLMSASSFSSNLLQACPQNMIARGSVTEASSFITTSLVISKNGEQMPAGCLLVTNTLACIWPHWDSPVDGVPELVVDIFQHMLRVCQQTGLCDTDDLHAKLMSSLLSLPWHSKARYRPLKVLLAFVDFLKVVDVHRQLSCDLLRCMKTNSLVSVVSDVYQACVQQILDYATRLGQTDGLALWADVWMSTLLTGLTSADSVQTVKVCSYWLPSTLKLLASSQQLLSETIEEHLRSSHGSARDRWLFAWASVAACGRELFHMSSESVLASCFLQESLLCADDDVRVEALKLVCTSLKRGEAMSDAEAHLLQEFITANLKTDSTAFRQQMTSALKKMFVRIRDSCLTAVRNSRTHESFLATSIQFVEWLHQLLMDSLLPGSCYQRQQTSLAVLRALLETLVYQPNNTSRKGKARESADVLLQYAQEQDSWKFFSNHNFLVLVGCLQDGVSEVSHHNFLVLVGCLQDGVSEVSHHNFLVLVGCLQDGVSEVSHHNFLVLVGCLQDGVSEVSHHNFLVLVGCLQDGVSEIQTQSYELLVKYHTWPKLTVDMFAADEHGTFSQTLSHSTVLSVGTDIFRRSLQLMSSPRAYENHGGMLMISLLINRYIMDLSGESSPASVELAQHLLQTNPPTQPVVGTHADTSVPHGASHMLLELVDMLVDRMKTSLDAVRHSLATSVHMHSLHGVTQSLTRVLLDITDAERKGLVSLSAVGWKTRLQEIVSLNQQIINFVLEVLAGSQNLGSCPSFAEMGEALSSQICTDQEPNDDLLSISPEFQLLLSWCWLNLKESCSCLGELTALLVRSEGGCPQAVLLLSDIGQIFVKMLTTCRHRGAIEGSRQGLNQFCCSLMSSHVTDLAKIPSTLLQQILDSVSQNGQSSSVTRRSAGLPIFIQTVLQAAHKHGHKTLLMSAVQHLYDIAAQELPAEHNQLQDLSQGHALHILKTIFTDASLAAQLMPLLSQMTILVLQGFDSPSWAIRNAATQLISTLVTRIFGQKSPDAAGGGMRLEVFAAQYPLLLQFLCANMEQYLASRVTVKPSTYIVLTLLSELGMSPLRQHSARCRDFLQESVMCFMSSPVYSLRKLSAQAYVALSALDMADETLAGVLQKMGQRTMKMNELHGWLLCVHCLMVSGTISHAMSTSLLKFVVGNSWVLLGLSSCWLPVSTMLQIIQMALAQAQPDLSLLDSLWQVVQACLETVSTSAIPLQIHRDPCLKHCLQTLSTIHRATLGLSEACTHQLDQGLLKKFLFSQDHLRQAALEHLETADNVTADASTQRAVLMIMGQDTDLARLSTCAHLLLRWAGRAQLHLQADDFAAARLASHWSQLQPVSFIMDTVYLATGSVLVDDCRCHLLEEWSLQLLAYSQPAQNEDLRLLAARSLAIAGANISQFGSACRNASGLDKYLTRTLRASLQLLDDTEVEVRQLVSRFLCQTTQLTSLAGTWCYPALSRLVVSEWGWSGEIVVTLLDALYTPGQLGTAVDAALSCRQQVLFEPETTSSMAESFIAQIWAYNTLQMLAAPAGSQVQQTLQATVRRASEDLSSNLALITDNLSEFPVFNMSCHKGVLSALLGLLLLANLHMEVSDGSGQEDSRHLQELLQSLLEMPFLYPFLGKSTLKDLAVAVCRLLPKQLPSLR
ncbi:hypothetical protein BsWGS_15202 [Bradybaena similaris]